MEEYRLPGGNSARPVSRAGATVRKPWGAETASVHEYMRALIGAGVDLPAVLGRDEQGRQVLEYVPGVMASEREPLDHDELARVGSLVRQFHDASESFSPAPSARWSTAIPAPGADLVCHQDLAPWNLVTGDRWVFIDWDAAAPSTRLWDLAYSAQSFALNDSTRPVADAAEDLAAFADGYRAGADLRAVLPGTMRQRVAAMVSLLEGARHTGLEPWASMEADGHGSHWRDVLDYVSDHEDAWRLALA